MNDEWAGSQEEERARVGEVMLLSCLFLIGLSRDEEHNNSFVGSEGGESFCVRACAHVQGAVCDCVCVQSVQIHILWIGAPGLLA